MSEVVGISIVSLKFNFDESFKEKLLNCKVCFKIFLKIESIYPKFNQFKFNSKNH